MTGAGVIEGLANSAFLADLDDRDRNPLNILGIIALGLIAGFIAAFVTMMLVLSVGALIAGHGHDWRRQLSDLALGLEVEAPLSLARSTLLILVAAGGNSAFALGFIVVASILTRRSVRDFVTAAAKIRWRLLLLGLALSLLAFAPLSFVDRLTSSNVEPLPVVAVSGNMLGRLGYILMSLLLVPAAAAEEILFRGWLLKQVGAFSRRPVVIIAVTAVAFSAIHLDFNPDSFLARVIMGAGFAYMTLRLGGIELSTAVHAANNILILLFIEPLALQISSHAGPPTAAGFLDDAVLIVSYVAITELVVRAPILRRWSGLRDREVSPLLVA